MATVDSLQALATDLDIPDLIRIADVGANPSDVPVYQTLLDAGFCQLIGFEPHPEAFATLKKQNDKNIRYIQAAVGDGLPVNYHSYPESTMSSIFPLSRRSLNFLGHFKRHLGKETVSEMPTCALDALDNVPALDLLKMDAQGAELEVLQSARRKLCDAAAVIVEMRFYRLYDGEPMLGDLDQELRDQGFVLHRFLHQKSRMLRHSQASRVNSKKMSSQLIDGDAVYIRSLELPKRWSDRQLKVLAMLANAVFSSHDLALRCLDLLYKRGGVAFDAAHRYVDRLPQELRVEETL